MASLQPKYPSTLVPNNQTSERNIHFILPILSPYLSALPASARVLELASGTGTHVSALAKAFPSLTFQPTECDDYGVAQVDQGVAKLAGVQPAIKLDVVEAEGWSALEATVEGQDRPWDLVYAANYAHMIPHPEGHEAIFRHLRTSVNKAHGKFCVYGPFKTDAGFLSEGDAKFDAMIRAREGGEKLGLRSIEDLQRIARKEVWELERKVDMPAGNFILVWALAA